MEEKELEINNELSGLTIKELFYKYLRFLPWVVICLALSLLGAWLYLRYATQIYGATGTMLINSEQKGASRGNDKVEELISGNAKAVSIQNEMEVLKSKPLMQRVVKKLDLNIQYHAIGKIKEVNAYKRVPFEFEIVKLVDELRSFNLEISFDKNGSFQLDNGVSFKFDQLFENNYGIFRIVKKTDGEIAGKYKISYAHPQRTAAFLATAVKVAPKIAGTGILNVNIQSTSASMAADVINELMAQYDSLTIEQNNYSSDQTIAFIDDRLDKLKGEVDSLKAIEIALRQRDELFNVEIQSGDYLTKLRESGSLLTEQEYRIASIDLIDAYIKNASNRFTEVVPSSLGLEDPTLNELVMSYNKAQLERQTLINANIPEANPAVVEATGVIEKQRKSLIENLHNIKLAYLDKVSTIQKNNTGDKNYLQNLPLKVKELVEIERQAANKLTLYNLLEAKKEEAAISRASTVSSSKVVELARPNETPVSPNRTMIQLIAALIGLGLPILVIFAMELLNDKITSRNDIERNTNVPVLGEVGHSFADNTLVVGRTSRSMIAEQFRIIRSNLQYVLNKTEKPVILVTSSYSGEGKSFISTNMAGVMAVTGKKTIILEFDIRKPKVLSGLNMSKKAGISNYLVGKEELDNLIFPVPDTENFYVLPCGPIPPNPSELLLDTKVAELFTGLKQRFDVIVIDTAPVGMVSDAMTLGSFADCTLYIARQGYTVKKQIGLINELYTNKKLPRLSIIINDVKVKTGYGYYGYGRYGYGYGYGEKSGYYEEEQKPTRFWDKLFATINPLSWLKTKK